MFGQFSRYQVATAIAVLFHVIGFCGILFFERTGFVQSTPANLLLMLALLVWTQQGKGRGFWLFFFVCFLAGMCVEIAGVHTGWLFGHYFYGNVLGYKILDTPLIIGVNWFVVVFCSGAAVELLATRLQPAVLGSENGKARAILLKTIAGALLTVFFDWLMEPVAIQLHYWQWQPAGSIPLYNYFCWFMVSALLLLFFYRGAFNRQNIFAVNLLVLQVVFFLLLRLFLQ